MTACLTVGRDFSGLTGLIPFIKLHLLLSKLSIPAIADLLNLENLANQELPIDLHPTRIFFPFSILKNIEVSTIR